jgi:hypothetical protein
MNKFQFSITFASNETLDVDLFELIGKHLKPEEVSTMNVNSEWGCLEFKEGNVDIEPLTLYKFAKEQTQKSLPSWIET